MVDVLLNKGKAKAEVKDQDGWTPLHRCCQEKPPEPKKKKKPGEEEEKEEGMKRSLSYERDRVRF